MFKLDSIKKYYTDKINTHGPTAQGVDWNSKESQYQRFAQLVRGFDFVDSSMLDLGCGYAEFFDYLRGRGFKGSYHGIDLSEAMVNAAKQRHGSANNYKISLLGSKIPEADLVVASGLFSVKLDHDDQEWLAYIESTVKQMFRSAKKGIAFNCLTSYSDKEKMRDDLFYAKPEALFQFCKQNLSRHVALFHDYGLYEFTLSIKKDS